MHIDSPLLYMLYNLALISLAVSEKKIFENVNNTQTDTQTDVCSCTILYRLVFNSRKVR